MNTGVYESTRQLTEAELAEQTTRLQLAVAVSTQRESTLDRINGVVRDEGRERAVEGLE